MILLSNGDAYIGGFNDSGQLGIGNKTNRLRTLIKITESNLKLISCSAYASMYITSKDKIFLSGDRSIQNNSGSASGYTFYTGVGVSTSIISKFTEVPNVLITDKDILAYGMYNSYIGRKQNIILGCGNNSTSMSNDFYTNTFNKLTLPF